jgi:sensor histidine kinase YesM
MDPELKTSKEDKSRHGIGLESIRETARKYDGDTLLEYKDGIFESVVNVEE